MMTLAVFAATFVADFAWARYTASVGLGNRQTAAVWSAVIVLLGAVTVLGYAHDWKMVFPAALGAYAGTLTALWSHRR
jgi:hypothetical protein